MQTNQDTVFSIIITTKDRCEDLLFTLDKISTLIARQDVECLIWDDGSSDGTFEKVSNLYPSITIWRNEVSKGLIYSRNRLLEKASGLYAVSLDDDLNFLSDNPLGIIAAYFEENPLCAVISFRIFWNKQLPETLHTSTVARRVRSFAGGANAWRMSAWRTIRDYPEWFLFYGEEDFAAYELLRAGLQVHYVPEILTHHRVDMGGRRKTKDFVIRQRRSLRSGWYLYLLFFPWNQSAFRIMYSVWKQLSGKVFKGDFTALKVLFLAGADVVRNFPRILNSRKAFTPIQLKELESLAPTTLFWTPEP